MVSRSNKRMANVTDESSSESDFEVPESSITVEEQSENSNRRKNTRARILGKQDSSVIVERSARKPKCFSRNALLARENRIKKKIYVSNLESELSCLKEKNKLLSKMLKNQALLMEDLKKEVKYLKSVLANSTDISKLVHNIRQSTGMSVTSSVFDSTLSLNNCISKLPHPSDHYEQHSETPLPPREMAWSSSLLDDASYDLGNVLMNDVSLGAPFSFELSDQLNDASPLPSDHWSSSTEIPEEHNYTLDCRGIDDDTGICLHVSKHRVSLEFCSSCSDNASQAWSK